MNLEKCSSQTNSQDIAKCPKDVKPSALWAAPKQYKADRHFEYFAAITSSSVANNV